MRNKKGQFRKFSLAFKIKLAFLVWYEKKKYIIAAAMWVLIVGSLLGFALFSPKISTPEAVEPTISNEVVKVTKPYCIDVVGCIRDIGEELGETNKDIMQMIRIAKYESGYRTDAINKNTNGTYDIGIFMINDVHSKRISRSDRFDMEKNIRFAYKLHQEQTKVNSYGESINKVWYVGVALPGMINRESTSATADMASVNVQQTLEVSFLRQECVERSVYPEVGDIIDYHDTYYEINNINEVQCRISGWFGLISRFARPDPAITTLRR